ncbi:MAG: DUF4040 domain-containing protein [Phormidesmis sp. RL_2_1]|nr:DUF4040 domain-containing protein [Phormidesmis sp. RL_2_1]
MLEGTFEDGYMIAITALLPLTACLLVFQVNPYQALIVRGILGAIAALVYALFGAADVALTEALVGTMLSITLYAIAVRSSMSMRLGLVLPKTEQLTPDQPKDLEPEHPAPQLISDLSSALSRHHMRLEQVVYPTPATLQAALVTNDIHAAYGLDNHSSPSIHTRLRQLYDILQAELPPTTNLIYFDSYNQLDKGTFKATQTKTDFVSDHITEQQP